MCQASSELMVEGAGLGVEAVQVCYKKGGKNLAESKSVVLDTLAV